MKLEDIIGQKVRRRRYWPRSYRTTVLAIKRRLYWPRRCKKKELAKKEGHDSICQGARIKWYLSNRQGKVVLDKNVKKDSIGQ